MNCHVRTYYYFTDYIGVYIVLNEKRNRKRRKNYKLQILTFLDISWDI